MARVHVLPEVLAHKIAAGEIVERPASAVKELVENSLDADARRVVVEVQDGGRKRICVRDDGIGMSREDAQTAFQHHATSKIATFEDLTAIRTLGFRGEALPSIASVSRLRLRTVDREKAGDGSNPGTEIVYEGGVLRDVRDVAWHQGTEITVEELFFNVPARRKFLKSEPTELSHVTRQVMHYALAYPDVEFELTHQGRSLIQAVRAQTFAERVYQIFGDQFLQNLAEVDLTREGIRVHGLTSLPHEQRTNASHQFLFVNRRVIKDRVLNHAVRQAYQDLLPPTVYPVTLLFVEIEPGEVDVNVHPCKTEIRFRDSSRVHSAIYHGIEEALLRHRVSLRSLSRPLSATQLESPYPNPDAGGPDSAAALVGAPSGGHSGQGYPGFQLRSFNQPGLMYQPAGSDNRTVADLLYSTPAKGRDQVDPHGDNSIPETIHISGTPLVLGQFVESFIVVTERDSVLLIDQHVAHERILYDRALRSMGEPDGTATQRLLIPAIQRLEPRQAAVFEHVRDQLNENGFEVEWFGDNTIVVKGIPAMAGNCDAGLLLSGILDDFTANEELGGSRSGGIQRFREKLAINMACRAAIKINTPLTVDKMHWIVDTLLRSENPYTCPHGRPILLRLGIEEILRGFKRI